MSRLREGDVLARASATSPLEEFGWSLIALVFGGIFLIGVPIVQGHRSWPQYLPGTIKYFTTIDVLAPAYAIAVGVIVQWSVYRRSGRGWSAAGWALRVISLSVGLVALVVISGSWHPLGELKAPADQLDTLVDPGYLQIAWWLFWSAIGLGLVSSGLYYFAHKNRDPTA